MAEPVILDAVRLPVARKDGSYAGTRADDLYARVIDASLDRAKIDPAKVQDVVTGVVTQTGEQGANIGRQAALMSRLPRTTAAVTLSRLCGSSQQAIHFAAQAVAAGDMSYVMAGGVESMSRVPMFSDIGGGFERLNPRLLKKYEIIHQGESAERIAEKYGLTRDALDRYSAESHVKAARATKEGRFAGQWVTVESLDKEGKPRRLEWDEGIRPEPDLVKMGKLPTVFRKEGVITAANSSQISDGAGVILIGDKERAKADGLKPRARFRARIALGGDPTLQLLEVIPATRLALEKAGCALQDIDVIEINEAFASVVLAWGKDLHPDWSKVNPNGGAIAHGHPLGATGAVLMTKLLHELERSGGTLGLQVMCIGHGLATATIIERI